MVSSAGLSVAQTAGDRFNQGEAIAARLVPIEIAYRAVHETLSEFQYTVCTDRFESNAYIEARGTGGGLVQITLKRHSPVVTQIKVRVGLFGDKALSGLLLRRLDERLPDPPDVPPMTVLPGVSAAPAR